ncbi:UDP-N-acetylmuramoyl-L-alanyl-D-glutamate--2,6-diaminopimelate ligase [Clostridium sp.]
MKLTSSIKHLNITEIKGTININISGVEYNSKSVKDNYIFVAIEGLRVDGHLYINDAITNGAKVIVVSKDIEDLQDVTVIKVKDTRAALSTLSADFYDYPSKNLELIGVTGTNGKTTTTYLLKSILDVCKRTTSLIGTIETIINEKSFYSTHTTPESLELQGMFKSMLQSNVDTCVMEVSSHSIQLARVNDCDFNIGIFTNLTHEHLDFHNDMENYYNTKKQLFYKTNNINIVNIDDIYGTRLAHEIKHVGPRLLTYGIDNNANIYANEIISSERISEFMLNTPNGKINITINIPGKFNIYNSLAAATCGYALGLSLTHIKEGLEAVIGIPGRFEVVPTNNNFNIIIDYAHTPDGFEKILETVDKFAKGRKILVFGCVGERDHTKRSQMGKIAEQYCDLCVLTTDNCRSEDPSEIINDIKQGFKNVNRSYIEILDRSEAIRYAIINSKKNDTIIITGKGHDKRQIIGDNVMYFDEKEIILQALESF